MSREEFPLRGVSLVLCGAGRQACRAESRLGFSGAEPFFGRKAETTLGSAGLAARATSSGFELHAFPSRDHRGRQAVAEQIHRGSRHIHQRVDAQQQRDAFCGRLKVARVPARITRDARGTPATPLLVSISVSIIVICVPKGNG